MVDNRKSPISRDLGFLTRHAVTYFRDIKQRQSFVQGENISYLEAGSGDVVLLLHGLDGSRQIWRLLANYLKKSYRVIALDIPGMTVNSRPNKLSGFSIADTVHIVDQFIEKMGLEKVHVAGLSAGSTIAAYFALKFPNRVASLTFFSMPTLFKEADYIQGSIEETCDFLIPNDMAGVEKLIDYLFYERPNLPGYLLGKFLDYSVNNRGLRLSVLNQILRQTVQLVPRLSRLTVPSLLIYGDSDSALPERSVEYLTFNVPGIEICKLPNTGHFSIIESPSLAASSYLRFLKEHPKNQADVNLKVV